VHYPKEIKTSFFFPWNEKYSFKKNNDNAHFFLDCDHCFDDILAAVGDCISFTDPAAIIKCVQDIIGVGHDCYDCICELITDIGNVFGQDWHC